MLRRFGTVIVDPNDIRFSDGIADFNDHRGYIAVHLMNGTVLEFTDGEYDALLEVVDELCKAPPIVPDSDIQGVQR